MELRKSGFAWTRALGLGVVIMATGLSMWLWCKAATESHALTVARASYVGRFRVDLSEPGVYEGYIQRDYGIAHGEVLLVTLGHAAVRDPAVFDGLSGRWQWVHADGSLGKEQELAFERLLLELPDVIGKVYGMPLNCPAEGRLRITVDTPAAALAGQRQSASVRHEFCGLEYLRVFAMRCVAFLAAVFAVVLGVPVWLMIKRLGFGRGSVVVLTPSQLADWW